MEKRPMLNTDCNLKIMTKIIELHAKLFIVISNHFASQIEIAQSCGCILNLETWKPSRRLIEASEEGPSRRVRYRWAINRACPVHPIYIELMESCSLHSTYKRYLMFYSLNTFLYMKYP